MHLGTAALLRFYQQHRDDESLVLVTIIGTEGSTYRKTGAMMLIAKDHQYVGMISGGCLEGDLLHHADEVFASGKARKITYDMHAGDSLVWSLGIGCDGIIHLQMQRFDRSDGYAALEWMATALVARQSVLLVLDTGLPSNHSPSGELALYSDAGDSFGSECLARIAAELSQSGWPEWRYQTLPESGLLLINIPPQPRILLCGAGPDAVPVVAQFLALGWDCVVVDHRPAFTRADRFEPGCELLTSRPEKLHLMLELDGIDAAIIMAHHLENDAAYLRQLTIARAATQDKHALAYLGVLGPASRRQKLCEMAGCDPVNVHGPVGLDIGAELPEAIALSVAAEVHAVLNLRNGLSLTNKINKTAP